MVSDGQIEWRLMVDGASRGNPGQAGCGAVIYDENGSVIEELFRYLGSTTNNVAEYQGLLMGLKAALERGARSLQIQSDSELLVRQLNGVYRVKNAALQSLYKEAVELLGRFEAFGVTHVRREFNKVADRLANRAIDEAPPQR